MSTENENQKVKSNATKPVKDIAENQEATNLSMNKRDTTKPKPTFAERWENSRFSAVRISYKVAHSMWTVVMAVGMFLAWLIALLAT